MFEGNEIHCEVIRNLCDIDAIFYLLIINKEDI